MKNDFLEPNTQTSGKGALDRQQAANYLSISTRFLDDLLTQGIIPKIKIGRKTLVRICDLDAFLASKLEGQK
ncbi:helix-turn-helix domain-containing protein [Mariniblastus sp.]|nr:helix-turn-helix domain-containing protein [Mariniblastus sp.]